MKIDGAIRGTACALVAALLCSPARPALIDDPAAGARSGFEWVDAGGLHGIVDLGPGDGVSGEAGSTGWTLQLETAGFLGLELTVYNRPPTTFELLVDGDPVAWTTAVIRPEVISPEAGELIHHFDATLEGHRLDAGTHVLTLAPSLSNSDGSTGMVAFAPVRAIPEPSRAALLAIGAALLLARLRAFSRRDRR